MKTLTVALGDRSYPIYLGAGILEELPARLSAAGVNRIAAIVTDSNVGPLYADRVARMLDNPVVCTLPAGEEQKRLEGIEWLCGRFLSARVDRSSTILALGGGIVGDMAGFAAAVHMRGIPFVQVPTTIVAQVDSSVGGKTGVNHPLGKNTIGAFHQPSAVVIDVSLLQTLPEREVRAGLAEVIKHGVIADAKLFEYLERQAKVLLEKDLIALEWPILRSCEIKSEVVAEDEFEHGRRAILNYGHTFGHAIEAVTHYEVFLHGEAVALGMIAAGNLAHSLGMVDDAFVARQRDCIQAFGLPTTWSALPLDDAMRALWRDKKVRDGKLKFVLPDALGHVVLRTDITDYQACAAFAAIGEE